MIDGKSPLDARNIPDAVLWSEGMQLSPQHFQLAQRRMEQLVAYLAAAVLPYRWGIVELTVPSSPLAQGVFEVERLEAVLRDGLVVSYPLENSLPLSLDLRKHDDIMRKGPCTVHLAVLAQDAHPATAGWCQAADAAPDAAHGRAVENLERRPLLGLATLVHPSVGLQLSLTLMAGWFAWGIGWRRTGVGSSTATSGSRTSTRRSAPPSSAPVRQPRWIHSATSSPCSASTTAIRRAWTPAAAGRWPSPVRRTCASVPRWRAAAG